MIYELIKDFAIVSMFFLGYTLIYFYIKNKSQSKQSQKIIERMNRLKMREIIFNEESANENRKKFMNSFKRNIPEEYLFFDENDDIAKQKRDLLVGEILEYIYGFKVKVSFKEKQNEGC